MQFKSYVQIYVYNCSDKENYSSSDLDPAGDTCNVADLHTQVKTYCKF